MKQYCPVCGCMQETTYVQKDETYPVKGESITVHATVCICSKCEEELMSFDCDDDTLRKAYDIYRMRHGLLMPEEIKNIRNKYGVSQVNFARILGVGDKTITRYENGTLQDEAINNLIVLASDPKNFMRLLDMHMDVIPKDEVTRLRSVCGRAKVFTMWSNDRPEYAYDFYQDHSLLQYA